MRKGARNGADAILTPFDHQQPSEAHRGETSVLMRLMVLVLTWALLLLPSSFGASPVPTLDRAGKQAVVRDGNVVLSLSSYDRGQSALRSSDPVQSGKSSGGAGKALFETGIRLRQPEQQRLVSSRRLDTAEPTEKFAAFSARAPPQGA
ncbi:hypothetical protein ACFFTN_20920 [Aminobacter aganoensis]|uniref:Uncharacterized protein n=1 Tax=Aminobacter aganoensis TaxID=83264 RepID=A0A7X0FC23_9HYPH|nr:hypothetical protein [Aminobacter aganoensis]MBB6356973.1 hypothetical protein [Aminobacter aganoensis]